MPSGRDGGQQAASWEGGLVISSSVTAEKKIVSKLALGLGAGICFLALAGALGWLLQIPFLQSIFPDWARMKPNTSLCLILCGWSLIALSLGEFSPLRLRFFAFLAAFVAAVGMATLFQYLSGISLGIDALLFRESVLAFGGPHPGRMSPSGAFCFLLAGITLWLSFHPARLLKHLPLVQAFSLALSTVGVFSLVGYLIDSFSGYRGWNYTGMAAHTATAFILLGAGLWFHARARGGLGWFVDRGITLGFFTGTVVLLMAVNMAHHFTGKMQRVAAILSQRQYILREIEELEMLLSPRESGRVSSRSPAERGRIFGEKVAVLRVLTQAHPDQQKNIAALDREMARGMGAMLQEGGEGQFRVRELLRSMQAEEYWQLDQDQQEVESASALTFLLLPMGAFVSLALLLGGLFYLNAGLAQRQRAEEKTRERETRLTALTENIPGLVAQVDENLRYVFVNGTYERWFGRKPEDIVGLPLSEVIGPEAFRKAEPFARAALQGRRGEYENRVLTRDGKKIDLLVSLFPHTLEGGGTSGFFVVAMDITSLKEAESEIRKLNADLEKRVKDRTCELEAANRELEAFSYSVSHDLRAPLRTVDGFSQAVLEDYGSSLPEDGRRYLELVRGGAQRMGALIDDLLTFSRLSRLQLEPHEVSMKRLVQDCLAELDVEGLRKIRKIELQIDPLPDAQGDSTLLRQAWMNLISNALKYTRRTESARIHIGAREEDGATVYFIRDNGTGFDMRYADKLFGVFQRLHRAEDYEGTGVGLAIVQRVVHRHGGSIRAEAKPGEGAAFYFNLGETA